MKSYFSFQWHITDECDQRCKHCYIFSGEGCKELKTMTWKQMQEVVANCEDFCKVYNRVPYFYITGGDPILHPDFWKLMVLLKSKDIPFTLMGNPFHLDDQICRMLKVCGCEKYQMSLDGMRKTHDWFRKPGSFDLTLEKVECLNRAGLRRTGGGTGEMAAGFTYSGKRFDRYFSDFAEKYHFSDMYSGGFYNYDTLEEYWGYWSRYIYVNRYMDASTDLYNRLFALVKDKDYFVLTTNVDHCFQKAGFDKSRLFYTQGDYGLFQCSKPCHRGTYDNEEIVKKMVVSQGYRIENGNLTVPEGTQIRRTVPTELVPRCPKCGRPMSMNLRVDNTFVQDAGWDAAAKRYEKFMEDHRGQNVVFLELGVGYNTPGIIKYNFWQYAYNWRNAFYVCINKGDAYVPKEIENKAVGIDADLAEVMKNIQ